VSPPQARDVYYEVGRRPERSAGRSEATRSKGDDLEERAARALMRHGEDVVGEVKGVDELDVRVACRGARSRGDRRSEIEVDPKSRGLRHDMSDHALETVEESRAFWRRHTLDWAALADL